MIKKRIGVFETNSSSMHSLVIKKSGHKQSLSDALGGKYSLIKGNKLKINEDDLYFDREPFKIITSAIDKFFYLIADISNNDGYMYDDVLFHKLTKSLKTAYPEIEEIVFPIIIDDELPFLYKTNFYGFVDHQSKGMITNYLKDNNIDPVDFIQNTKYIIIIDGDEYCIWDNFKDENLINIDEIETEINPFSKVAKPYEKELPYED